jgi:hypothetical protein
VNGFAGGGIYFIVAPYNDQAEQIANITHGQTFEKILKDGYKVTAALLKVSGVTFAFNKADGETCYSDNCTLTPRAGFKAGGAGGAIYALGADKLMPSTVIIDGITTFENLSAHNDDKQKAELVFRDVDKVVVKAGTYVIHNSNKRVLSLISVADADLTASPTMLVKRAAGLVNEDNSHVKP